MRANPRLHAKPFSKLSLRVYVGASTCVVWIGIGQVFTTWMSAVTSLVESLKEWIAPSYACTL